MSPNLLSLPPELLTQISNLVLLPSPTSSTIRISVSPPRARFTYDDAPQHVVPSTDSKGVNRQQPGWASISPLRTPPSPTSPPTPGGRSTRSTTLAKLRRRSYNPHRTHTAISLLLVCRYLYALGTPIYYGQHYWDIGIHARSPTIPTFRYFLDNIGPLARAHIRTIVVVSSHGYGCFWEGLPSAWVSQLQRCAGLRLVIVAMSSYWVTRFNAEDDTWKRECFEAWQKKGLGHVRVKAGALNAWQVLEH